MSSHREIFRFRLICALATGAVASGCGALGESDPEAGKSGETVASVSLAIAATPQDLCEFTVYSRQQTDLRDRATSATGFVGSASAVSLGNDSVVTGHVRSTGTVTLGDRSRVNGNVTAGGAITPSSQSIVTGTVSRNTPVPALTIPTKTVTPGSTDVSVSNAQTRLLAPGSYRDLHAFGGSTLNLRAGTYNLRSFIVESSSAHIVLDITNGPIDINVQNELRFGDGMRMDLVGGTNPRQVRYYSNWPSQLSIGNDLTLFGVVTAPNAQIVGFSRTNVRGSLFGQRVSLGPDNSIRGACECGNGIVDPNEQCDDGNTNNGDACTNTCKLAVCGDGIVRVGVEQCDDGNASDSDACTSQCKTAVCGDGFIRTGFEACDDGNTIDTDACTAQCAVAVCGDGIVHAGAEECDDGNTNDIDSCTTPGAFGEPGCEFRPMRQNIAHVSSAERQKLINAIVAADQDPAFRFPDAVSFWDKQDQIHQATHVHGGSSFIPWHRELVNRFEKLLRKIDPSVALHYWDWTTDPTASSDGLGGTLNLLTNATFGNATGRAGDPFNLLDNQGVFAGSRDASNPEDFTLAPAAISRFENCPALSGSDLDAALIASSDGFPQDQEWLQFRTVSTIWSCLISVFRVSTA